MLRLISRLSPLIPILLLPLCWHTRVSAGIAPEDEARILRTSQVRAGMQGYGLTVFRGDTIERFDVKVLGVLPNTNSGRPLILVRVGGGELSKREINIAEGMSGSPVFMGGKIIGAIAYSGEFAREPLGLVTPIEDMLEAWDPSLPAVPPGFGEITPLPAPVSVGGADLRAIGIRAHPGDDAGSGESGQAWFSPMATPLIASGFSQKSLSALQGALGGMALSVRQGPGRMKGSQPDLREGSAVGFSLATGDAELTSIGTVTYRRGDRILAFGHPFLGAGAVGAPMSSCWVHDVFTSYLSSFKLASPVSVIGASTQDRPFSVAGALGGKADMLPIEINVGDSNSPTPLRFRASVIKHPMVTPILTQMLAGEAVQRKRPYPGEGMARVTTTVTGKNVGPVTRTNLFFSSADIGSAVTADLSEILSLFQSNKFHPVLAEKIAMDVQIIQTRQTAEIEKIMLDRLVFEPGETVDVAVQLRPYRSEPVIRHLRIKVPDTAVDGKAIIAVQGGRQAAGAALAPASADTSGSERSGLPEELKEAATIEQFFSRYQQLSTNEEMVGRLLMSSASFSVEGERLTGLPPGLEYALQSKKATGARLIRDEVKVRQDTEWFTSGTQLLGITIQKRSHSEKATPTAGAVVTTSMATSTSTTTETTETGTITISEDEETMSTLLAAGSLSDALRAMDTGVETTDASDSSTQADAGSTESGDSTEETADESKDTSSGDKAGETKLNDLGRAAKTWRQASTADLLKGKMSAVAVGSAVAGTGADQADGTLQPGMKAGPLASVEDPCVWSVCPGPDGSAIAGTGSHGAIYRIAPDGAAEKLFSVGGSQALSVLRDRKGRIWAGSSPDGAIWLHADGKTARLVQTPSKHVAALACGPEDSVLAAAGDSGKVWRVTPDGKLSLFADTGQMHVQCLWTSADGATLAGTARSAAVWRISNGKAEAILNTAEEFVGSVAANAKGAVFATTGPKGKLYLIEKNKAPVVLINKLSSNTAPLALDAEGSVVLADASRIYRYPEKGGQTVQRIEGAWDFQSLATLESGGLAAGLTNGGGIWRLSPAGDGWFESTVRDAERPAKWGRMNAAVSGGADGVQFQVRHGDVAEPDNTWSAWKPVRPGDTLGLAGPRYAQYRVEFKAAAPRPEVSNVSFSYLPANRPPTVKFQKPAAGAGISGTQEISWSGSDPDKDKLSYELSWSSDAGATWNRIGTVSAKPSGKQPPAGKDGEAKTDSAGQNGKAAGTAAQDAESHANDLLEQTKKALDSRPDIPATVRERILETAKQAIERRKAAEQEASAETDTSTATNGTSQKWDTSKVPDGQYLLRVVASDVLANSSEALTAEAFLGPLTVTNTKPTITLGRAAVALDERKEARVSGFARSKAAVITSVQFRTGKPGEWYAAEPDDGLFDSAEEAFTCVLRAVKPGKTKLEVQAQDSAGNVAKSERDVEVKDGGKPAPDTKAGG